MFPEIKRGISRREFITMSSGDEWEGIKLTWNIENFSYCLKNIGTVRSPFFGFNSPEWQVKICNTNNKRISVSLHNNKVNNEYRIKTFNCSVEFLYCDGLPLIWEQQENVRVHESAIISIIDFGTDIKMNNSNNYKFLPNNTLTIHL